MARTKNGQKIRRAGLLALNLSHRLIGKAVIAIDQALVFQTPVDTGLARSNWQTGVGFIPSSPVANRGAGAVVAEARAAARQFEQGNRREPGSGPDTIYIVNNLDYISELNRGSSRQAAASFVERAVEAGARFVRLNG